MAERFYSGALRAFARERLAGFKVPAVWEFTDSLPRNANGKVIRAQLIARASDIPGTLRELVDWAECHHLDLSGLEVGPPSLEDAYLTAIGQPLTPEATHD